MCMNTQLRARHQDSDWFESTRGGGKQSKTERRVHLRAAVVLSQGRLSNCSSDPTRTASFYEPREVFGASGNPNICGESQPQWDSLSSCVMFQGAKKKFLSNFRSNENDIYYHCRVEDTSTAHDDENRAMLEVSWGLRVDNRLRFDEGSSLSLDINQNIYESI